MPDTITLGGLGLILLLMLVLWRRSSAGLRVVVLVGLACYAEWGALLVQVQLPVILDTSLWHFAANWLPRRHGARRNPTSGAC